MTEARCIVGLGEVKNMEWTKRTKETYEKRCWRRLEVGTSRRAANEAIEEEEGGGGREEDGSRRRSSLLVDTVRGLRVSEVGAGKWATGGLSDGRWRVREF